MENKQPNNRKKLPIKPFVYLGLISALLYNCAPKVFIEPKELPPAKVGEYYEQSIMIYGAYPLLDWKSIGPMIEPHITSDFGNNLDMSAKYAARRTKEYDNLVWVKGTPQHKGVYHIHVYSAFYGGGGLAVDKTFELVVE